MKARLLLRRSIVRIAAGGALLCALGVAFAAQVTDSVLDDVQREFSLDSASPADFSNLLIAPTQGASYPAVMGTPPAPLPPNATPGMSAPSTPAPAAQPAPTCGQMLPYYGLQAGPGSVCTCPNNNWSATVAPTCTCANGSAGPVCATPCQVNLPAAQAAAGPNQTCSCPGPVTSPVQTVEPLSTYTSSGWINAANWPDPSAKFIYGPANNSVQNNVTDVVQTTFTNSSQNNISATLYLVADDAAAVTMDGVQIGYYSDGGQGGSGAQAYPSTGGVASFPVTITPGTHTVQMAITNSCPSCSAAGNPSAGMLSIIDANGNVLLDTNASWFYIVSNGASTPVCQTNCGGLLATSSAYQTNANQVCSCADPSAIATPTCQQTCGALLAAAQASAPSGSVCSCPGGNTNLGTPVCTQTCGSLLGSAAYPSSNCSCPGGADSLTTPTCQSTCGNLLSSFQAQAGSNQTCSCPNGANSYANPVCVTNCQGQIATLQGQYGNGYVCTCTDPQSTTETPTCAQTCGSQLSAAQAAAAPGMVCSCPNGNSAPGAPVCQQSCDAQLAAAQASYGSSYVCSCPNGPTSTSAPVCQMTCGALMATNSAYATNADQTCSCPNGDANPGTPTCTLTCQGQLSATQNAVGSGYTCSCPSVTAASGVVWSPVQTVEPLSPSTCTPGYTGTLETCASWFDVAAWPDTSANWIYGSANNLVQNNANEILQTTWTNTSATSVSATVYMALDDFGTLSIDGVPALSYSTSTGGVAKSTVTLAPGPHVFQINLTNSCPNCTPAGNPSAAILSLIDNAGNVLMHTDGSWEYESSTTQGPVCTVNCGGFLSSSPLYASNASQVCSCPNGANSSTTPTCVPTCGSQLATVQAQQGPNYTCSCPNGNTNAGTPSCSLNCGGMMATQSQYQTNANQICSCPNGDTSTSTPVCQPTCGAQLPAVQNSYGSGYTCSCPNGNTNLGTPTCVMNCGGLMATNSSYQSNNNQVCSCPNGASSLTTPTCQTTCGGLLAQYQQKYPADTCTCPSGLTSITTPSCCHTVSGSYYGVQNWKHQPSSAYPTNYTSQQAVCDAVGARELAAGFPQFSHLTWDGTGCFDGNPGDAVNGYPAYPYYTGSWSQQVCP